MYSLKMASVIFDNCNCGPILAQNGQKFQKVFPDRVPKNNQIPSKKGQICRILKNQQILSKMAIFQNLQKKITKYL